jgi:hypothetical protein
MTGSKILVSVIGSFEDLNLFERWIGRSVGRWQMSFDSADIILSIERPVQPRSGQAQRSIHPDVHRFLEDLNLFERWIGRSVGRWQMSLNSADIIFSIERRSARSTPTRIDSWKM